MDISSWRLSARAASTSGNISDILTSTLFTAPVYKTYGGLIVGRKTEPAGLQHHWPQGQRTFA
jgi:hypothetical protein